MKLTWVKGLEKDSAKQIENAFGASSLLRQRMEVVLKEKYESADTLGISKDSYGSPNWGLLKADEVGYKRALKEIIKLIE